MDEGKLSTKKSKEEIKLSPKNRWRYTTKKYKCNAGK